MRTVLIVIHYPVFGGPHSEALALAPLLKGYGWHTVVLLPREEGNAHEILRSEGLDVVSVPLHRPRGTLNPTDHLAAGLAFRPEVQAIRRLIRARRVDLVQVSGLVNVHGAVAARLENTPIVWQLIDTRAPILARRLLMPLVIRWSDVVMSTGKNVARVHPGSERLGNRLQPFFMPVNATLFRPGGDKAAARASFGFDAGDRVLGTVGNLNPQKGHEYLLRTVARTRMDVDRVKALIVGAPHVTHRRYEQKLYQLSNSLGLEVGIDVVFTGAMRDVRRALLATDIFLCSSVPRSEGAPAAVEEAMMMGVPVVASKVGGLAEVVDDGVTGHLVPALDPESMAEAVVNLLKNDERRIEMGRLGREQALARFSAERCAEIHAQAYTLALRRHRSRLQSRRTSSSA